MKAVTGQELESVIWCYDMNGKTDDYALPPRWAPTVEMPARPPHWARIAWTEQQAMRRTAAVIAAQRGYRDTRRIHIIRTAGLACTGFAAGAIVAATGDLTPERAGFAAGAAAAIFIGGHVADRIMARWPHSNAVAINEQELP